MIMNNDRLSYGEQLERPEWQKKRDEILVRDSHRCQMCGSKGDIDNPLNVHHRYYIHPRYAWVYDNSALISLCKNCHTLVHLTMAPLIYVKRQDGGFIVMNFTPCFRCNAAGYFPEYKRIENGICFRCRGERYEELVDKKKLRLSNYITKEESFDYEKRSAEDKIIQLAFDVAVNYFSDNKSPNNPIDNPQKALNLYKVSAKNGYAKAQFNLGVIYAKGLAGVIKDYNKALRWFLYSAMQGFFKAKRNIAIFYEYGMGVPKNVFFSTLWERQTWSHYDNFAANYAIRIVKNSSLGDNVRKIYMRRLYDLADHDILIAKDFLKSIGL